MHRLITILCGISLLLVLLLQTNSYAQDETPGNIADMWIVTPKPGMHEAFKDAFKAHLKQRKKAGDSRLWQTYVPFIGDELNHYVVRFCCTKYAAMDAYGKWANESKLGEDWNKNVDPTVASYAHYFSNIDAENSHWPEDLTANFVGVTSYTIKPGQSAAVEKHKAAMSTHAKAMNWPYHWGWSYTVGGSGNLNLALPYANLAAMERPEKTFLQALSEHIGEEAATQLLKDWGESFTNTNYTVYRLDQELSMPKE